MYLINNRTDKFPQMVIPVEDLSFRRWSQKKIAVKNMLRKGIPEFGRTPFEHGNENS
jgi:hypothetical protein